MMKKALKRVGYTVLVLLILVGGGYYMLVERAMGPWLAVPEEAPMESVLIDDHYKEAGDDAQALLTRFYRDEAWPSLSVAVGVDNALVWAGAVGWADIAAGVKVTPQTRYRIGSTSKALTSALHARLFEDGIVELDTSIGIYSDRTPPQYTDVTTRQLASHTAGLPDYRKNSDYLGMVKAAYAQDHYPDVASSLKLFDGSSPLFSSGEGFAYSTFGTVLLSHILEAAADKPFLNLMQEKVFGPLGMKATAADDVTAPISDSAIFYESDGAGEARQWRYIDNSYKWAGGGFVSTPQDLVLFGNALLHDYISPDTRDTFFNPQKLKDGRVNRQLYALGWRNYPSDDFGADGTIIHHGGIAKGAQCFLMLIPDQKVVIAMMINTQGKDANALSRHVDDFVLPFLTLRNRQTK